MPAPVVQLFVAPDPGQAKRRRIAALHRAFEEAGAEVIAADGAHRAPVIDARAEHVCAVGGDGTLRHVVRALHLSGRAIPVSAYPAGTVNLLARDRGYPRSPRKFARHVLGEGSRASHHTAIVGDTPMLTCASVGPDSHVVAMLSPALKRRIGRAAYVVAFARLLRRWPRAALTVTCGGEPIACEAVYVAKGRFFAGPWSFAPQARAIEPLLHVVILRAGSRRRFLRFAWTLLRGLPVDRLPGVACFACTGLTIAGDTPAPVQIDGDIEARLPVTIALRSATTEFA